MYVFNTHTQHIVNSRSDPMALCVPILFRQSLVHYRLGSQPGNRPLLRGFVEPCFRSYLGLDIRSSIGDYCHVRSYPILLPVEA